MKRKAFALLLLFLLTSRAHAFQPACSMPQPKLHVNRPDIFSDRQEQWLGDLQAEMIEPRYTLLPADQSEYLDVLGQQLLKQLPPTSVHYTFRVFESPYLKAFSLAGGHVYISRKLIMDAQSEDELVAILAQEIGRVYIHHSASAITRLIESTLHVKHLGDRANVEDTFERMLNMPTDRYYSYLSFDEQRDDELMADRVGLYAMIRARFDAKAFPVILDRINNNGGYTGNMLTDVFELTPILSIRVRMAKRLVTSLPPSCQPAQSHDPDDFKRFQHAMEDQRIDPFVPPTPALASTPLQPVEPALRNVALSLDGRFILAQDAYQIHVLSAQPLKLLFSINAYHAMRAQFTPDSKSVVFHYNDMHVEKWSIATGQPTNVQDFIDYAGCVQTSLSPDGTAMACISPWYGLTGTTVWLKLADIANGKMLYENHDFFNYFNNTPIDASMRWSRDGRYFVATSGLNAMAYDLPAKSKIKLDDTLSDLRQQRFVFVGSDKMLSTCDWSAHNGSWDQLRNMCFTTFPGGAKLKQFPLPYGTLRSVADGSHFLFGPLIDSATALVDPATAVIRDKFIEEPVDMSGREVALEMPDGGVGLGEIGGKAQIAELPYTPLSAVTTSAFSPDGRYLAGSSRARGAVWDATSGRLIAKTLSFLSASMPDNGNLQARFLPHEATQNFNSMLYPMQSGSVTYTFSSDNVLQSFSAFDRLAVRDARTKAVLWSRKLIAGVPQLVPAEQDRSLLVSWYDKWSGHGKLTYTSDHPLITRIDPAGTVVEVVSNRTGKVEHQLLIPQFMPQGCLCEYHPADLFGSMLTSYSTHNETTVYRVDTGKRLFAFFGHALDGSDALGLIAATDKLQELNIYETSHGRRLAHLMLDQAVLSARFLPAQKQLLAFTASQRVYRIDLSNILAHSSDMQADDDASR